MTNEKNFSSQDYFLPEDMREELKQPLGELITESPTESLLERIDSEKPLLTIFVGDYCVQEAINSGYIPNISIIDGKNLRKKFKNILIPNAKVIKTKNPPASVTAESWTMIAEQIGKQIDSSDNKSKEPIVLFIDGEEDLLVFPAVIESPEGAFIIYGQPHEGVVLIKVTANVKFKFRKLIERMKVNKNED